jgi:hypothetical protein
MLQDGRCSIYEHRPATCRTYDCRIFPAAGIDPAEGDPTKAAVSARARRWRFGHPGADDDARHRAVRAAAAFVREHPEVLPDPALARTTTPLAVLAVDIHDGFLAPDPAGHPVPTRPEPAAVRVEIARRRAPEADPGVRRTSRPASREISRQKPRRSPKDPGRVGR